MPYQMNSKSYGSSGGSGSGYSSPYSSSGGSSSNSSSGFSSLLLGGLGRYDYTSSSGGFPGRSPLFGSTPSYGSFGFGSFGSPYGSSSSSAYGGLYGSSPSAYSPGPMKQSKHSFGPLATISEHSTIPSSASSTPGRRLPRGYVPVMSYPSSSPSSSSYSSSSSPSNYKKPALFDTENIDVTTPRQTTAIPGEIKREKTFGTIKRGRTVIRIRTQKLKENPYLSETELQQRAAEREKEDAKDKAREKLREELREETELRKAGKKAAGDKFREKFMIQSKKKKYAGYRRPTLSDIRSEKDLLQKELLQIVEASGGNVDVSGIQEETDKLEKVKDRLVQLDRRIARRFSKALKKANATDEDSSGGEDEKLERQSTIKLRKASSRSTISDQRGTKTSPKLTRKATKKFFFPQEGSSAVEPEIVEAMIQPEPTDRFEQHILAHRATLRRLSNQTVCHINPRRSSLVDLDDIASDQTMNDKICDEEVQGILATVKNPIEEKELKEIIDEITPKKDNKKQNVIVKKGPIVKQPVVSPETIEMKKPAKKMDRKISRDEVANGKAIAEAKTLLKKPNGLISLNGMKLEMVQDQQAKPKPAAALIVKASETKVEVSSVVETVQNAAVDMKEESGPKSPKAAINKVLITKKKAMLNVDNRSTSLDKVAPKLESCGKSSSVDSPATTDESKPTGNQMDKVNKVQKQANENRPWMKKTNLESKPEAKPLEIDTKVISQPVVKNSRNVDPVPEPPKPVAKDFKSNNESDPNSPKSPPSNSTNITDEVQKPNVSKTASEPKQKSLDIITLAKPSVEPLVEQKPMILEKVTGRNFQLPNKKIVDKVGLKPATPPQSPKVKILNKLNEKVEKKQFSFEQSDIKNAAIKAEADLKDISPTSPKTPKLEDTKTVTAATKNVTSPKSCAEVSNKAEDLCPKVVTELDSPKSSKPEEFSSKRVINKTPESPTSPQVSKVEDACEKSVKPEILDSKKLEKLSQKITEKLLFESPKSPQSPKTKEVCSKPVATSKGPDSPKSPKSDERESKDVNKVEEKPGVPTAAIIVNIKELESKVPKPDAIATLEAGQAGKESKNADENVFKSPVLSMKRASEKLDESKVKVLDEMEQKAGPTSTNNAFGSSRLRKDIKTVDDVCKVVPVNPSVPAEDGTKSPESKATTTSPEPADDKKPLVNNVKPDKPKSVKQPRGCKKRKPRDASLPKADNDNDCGQGVEGDKSGPTPQGPKSPATEEGQKVQAQEVEPVKEIIHTKETVVVVVAEPMKKGLGTGIANDEPHSENRVLSEKISEEVLPIPSSSETETLPNPLIRKLVRKSSSSSSSSGSSTSTAKSDGTSASASSTLSASSSGGGSSRRRMPSPPADEDSDEEQVSLDKICPLKDRPKYRKYEVEDFNFLKVLGKGSFGKVLLAELKDTDSYFAIKCLKKDVVLEDDDVECTMIERKVLLMGSKHPYLCHLFCTFQTESHLFFVMEYLNGGDLMFHIQQSGRFTEERSRFYGAEIVSGLKFLHKKGVMYRDLKLDNILLDYEGHIRIADFGMCKLQVYLDRTADTFCGTPDYMAPEIIKGLRYNQCVDWWAFGVLLYEMLVGQSPFSGSDEDELFWSICNEPVHFPRFLSKEAKAILERLLEKDASRRLGMASCAYGDVKNQLFFNSIEWEKLEKRELNPPYQPKLKHPLDVQYFDVAFTKEVARLTPVDKEILQSMDQSQFEGFSYTNPHTTD